MGLNANNQPGGSGNSIEPMESGTYPARLVMVVDLGLQNQRPFQGQEKKPAPEIALTYEFVDEFMKDEDGQEQPDKPRWLTDSMPFYSLDSEKANSTKRYLVFDPDKKDGGDWIAQLGKPINVTVVQNPGKGKNAGRIFENIGGIAPMRAKDAEKCAPLVNEARSFDLDAPDMEVFFSLPKWVQEKVQGNLTFEGSPLQKLLKDAKEEGPGQAEGADEAPKDAAEAGDETPY